MKKKTNKSSKESNQNPPQNVLIGRWCHSVEHIVGEGGKITTRIKNQGHILGMPSEGHYLIQLFSFIDGSPTIQRIFKYDDMLDWKYYDSAEEMNIEWEKEFERNRPSL